MKQHDLAPPEGTKRNRKRVGRGYGSGHVKTAGRGQKGQKSRSGGNLRLGFEGGQSPLIQRMPFKRGFHNPFKQPYEIVNLSDLARVGASGAITPDSLLALGLVDQRHASVKEFRVKVLGGGEVGEALQVRVHKVSAQARAKIEAAGGSVEELA